MVELAAVDRILDVPFDQRIDAEGLQLEHLHDATRSVRTIGRVQARTDQNLELRKALGQFATGITVITTRAADGSPVGLTVNSFASVSLEPPLLLWCLGRSSANYDAFRLAERHLVNVLAANQTELSKRFAARGPDRFAGLRHSDTDTGLPRLPGCIAWFECAIRSRYDEGDHVILVGRIEAFEVAPGRPLVFHDSHYVTDLPDATSPRRPRAPRG